MRVRLHQHKGAYVSTVEGEAERPPTKGEAFHVVRDDGVTVYTSPVSRLMDRCRFFTTDDILYQVEMVDPKKTYRNKPAQG